MDLRRRAVAAFERRCITPHRHPVVELCIADAIGESQGFVRPRDALGEAFRHPRGEHSCIENTRRASRRRRAGARSRLTRPRARASVRARRRQPSCTRPRAARASSAPWCGLVGFGRQCRFEHVDAIDVSRTGSRVPTSVVRERCAYEEFLRTDALRQVGRVQKRLAVFGLARALLGFTHPDHDVASLQHICVANDVEHLPVPASGVLGRAGLERQVAGPCSEPDRFLDVDGSRRREPMHRKFRHVAVDAVARDALDGLGDLAVEPNPAADRQLLIQGVLDEGVREREPIARRPNLSDQPRLHRALEQFERGVGVEVGGAGHNVEIEIAAHDGGRGEDTVHRIAETPNSITNDLADALWESDLLEIHCRDPPSVLALRDRSTLREMAEHLADEERVAAGLLTKCMREAKAVGVHRVAGDGLHHRDDIGVGEARERDTVDTGLASQRRQRRSERILGADVGLAVRANEQEATRGHGRDQVLQQLQRAPIGPMEIVQHDDHRAVGCQLPKGGGHRAVQRVLIATLARGPIGPRTTRAVLHRWHQGGQVAEHARCQTGELRDPGMHDVVRQRFDPRSVRRRHVFVAASVEDEVTVLERSARQLGRDAGLAQARFARQQDDSPITGVRGLQRVLQQISLCVPSDDAELGLQAQALRAAEPGAAGRGVRRGFDHRWPGVPTAPLRLRSAPAVPSARRCPARRTRGARVVPSHERSRTSGSAHRRLARKGARPARLVHRSSRPILRCSHPLRYRCARTTATASLAALWRATARCMPIAVSSAAPTPEKTTMIPSPSVLTS